MAKRNKEDAIEEEKDGGGYEGVMGASPLSQKDQGKDDEYSNYM